MFGRQLLGHIAPAGRAEDSCALHLEGSQDRRGVVGLICQRVALPRFVGIALPAKIRGVNPEAGEARQQTVKARARFTPGVEEEHRRSVGVPLNKARDLDPGAEPEVPDVGVHVSG